MGHFFLKSHQCEDGNLHIEHPEIQGTDTWKASLRTGGYYFRDEHEKKYPMNENNREIKTYQHQNERYCPDVFDERKCPKRPMNNRYI